MEDRKGLGEGHVGQNVPASPAHHPALPRFERNDLSRNSIECLSGSYLSVAKWGLLDSLWVH